MREARKVKTLFFISLRTLCITFAIFAVYGFYFLANLYSGGDPG
jgi:hypothetical protein